MRAFILGNSGELLDHDIDALKGENVFAVNHFPLWKPDIISHYVCADIGMAFATEVRELVPKTAKKYYSSLLWNTIYEEEGVTPYDTYPDSMVGFSESLRTLHVGGTVSYVALQIAYCLGFNPIYILGVDFGIPPNGIEHIPVYEEAIKFARNKNLRNPLNDKRIEHQGWNKSSSHSLLSFQYASSFLKDKGIEVINLSSGGRLKCFKREKFNNVISKKEILV